MSVLGSKSHRHAPFLNEVIDQAVVKFLTPKMGVTDGGLTSDLDLEDAVVEGVKGHIEGSFTGIEVQNVALAECMLSSL